MTALLATQRRLVELGRIRMGEKGARGEPKKLSTFRLTSASKGLLEKAADLYGGTVKEWTDAPDKGYYELVTKVSELDCVIPPIPNLSSQYYEAWSGGGCQKRCDGETELIEGVPCSCDPDDRECKVTTRVSVMLPRLPGLGVWRLESHGWNAATTLPATLEILTRTGKYIPAVIRMEQRSSKKDGKTRRFVVPVVDLPDVTLENLMLAAPQAGGGPLPTLPVAQGRRVDRPELPPAASPPAENPEWQEGKEPSWDVRLGTLINEHLTLGEKDKPFAKAILKELFGTENWSEVKELKPLVLKEKYHVLKDAFALWEKGGDDLRQEYKSDVRGWFKSAVAATHGMHDEVPF